MKRSTIDGEGTAVKRRSIGMALAMPAYLIATWLVLGKLGAEPRAALPWVIGSAVIAYGLIVIGAVVGYRRLAREASEPVGAPSSRAQQTGSAIAILACALVSAGSGVLAVDAALTAATRTALLWMAVCSSALLAAVGLVRSLKRDTERTDQRGR